MSLKQRRAIAYWLMLILGIILNSFQVYKYLTNQLEYSKLELVVLIVGVSFMIFPKFILDTFQKLLIRKNENNE